MDIARYWKTIVDTLQDGLMVVDSGGNIVAVNPAAEKLTGYSAEELIGSNCRELNCTGCDVFNQGVAEKWCKLFLTGEVRAKKCVIVRKDGRAVQIIKNASVLRDSDWTCDRGCGNVYGSLRGCTSAAGNRVPS